MGDCHCRWRGLKININSSSSSNSNSNSNSIRIISGKFRGRKLNFKPAEGLRPSADRVRETLFNWLMNDVIDSRCLDLYAGTGALGLEAISRGAAEVVFLELNKSSVENIKNTLSDWKIGDPAYSPGQSPGQVKLCNALSYLAEPREKLFPKIFNLVFCDPPFRQDLLLPTLNLLIKNHWIDKTTLIYLECEADLDLNLELLKLDAGKIKILKQKKTQQVIYSLGVLDY